MSPEQALAESSVDGRSDIYSLGCVGFEMLAGKPPFEGSTINALVARIVSSSVPSIRATHPQVSKAIDSVIAKALAKDPADRWQTGAEFSEALAVTRSGSAPSVSRQPSRRRAISSSVLGITAITAVVTSFVLLNGRTRNSDPPSLPAAVGKHDSAAVAAYQQGMKRLTQRTQRATLEALALMDESISIDSTFAPAWAGKARAYGWAQLWQFQIPGVSRDSLLALQLAASEKALDLDSLNPEIWLVNAATARAVDPTRRDVSMSSIRRALALDPNNAGAIQDLGWDEQDLGEMDSALIHMRRAVRMGYRQGATPYANHFYWRRQYDSAAAWSDSAILNSPRLPWARETAGATALMRGRYDDAEAFYQAALRLDEGPTRVRGLEGLAEVAAAKGDTARALKLIADAEKLTDRKSPMDHAALAIGTAYAFIGNKESALEWLETYRPRASLHFQLHLKRDPLLDPLRQEPRFKALLTR
jgi:tetratricopeptide (TPR) repeat protein